MDALRVRATNAHGNLIFIRREPSDGHTKQMNVQVLWACCVLMNETLQSVVIFKTMCEFYVEIVVHT